MAKKQYTIEINGFITVEAEKDIDLKNLNINLEIFNKNIYICESEITNKKIITEVNL